MEKQDLDKQIYNIKADIQKQSDAEVTVEMAHQLLLDLGEKLQDNSVSDSDKKRVLQAMVEKVELFPERLENGRYVKGITFKFPVMLEGEMTDQWWYKENPVETVVSMSSEPVQTFL